MNDEPRSEVWSSRAKVVFVGFVVIGGFLLLIEHWKHALPYLPWLFLAACTLMHVFMHRGHGHGGHAQGRHGRKR